MIIIIKGGELSRLGKVVYYQEILLQEEPVYKKPDPADYIAHGRVVEEQYQKHLDRYESHLRQLKIFPVTEALADELLKKWNSGIREVELGKDFKLRDYSHVSGGLQPVGEVGGKGLQFDEGCIACLITE